jgi:hypothetical protein
MPGSGGRRSATKDRPVREVDVALSVPGRVSVELTKANNLIRPFDKRTADASATCFAVDPNVESLSTVPTVRKFLAFFTVLVEAAGC